MTGPVPHALGLLARFWLEEVKAGDLETLAALPDLAEALPEGDPSLLTHLAVEYQRLFGFNLPPYESLFVDPSGMLMAPAALRVQTLYQQNGWAPPAGSRVGAPDHLGLELLALAAGLESRPALARPLHTGHLAWWAPLFVLTLRRLKPHPFYAALGDLTLELLLTFLPTDPGPEPRFPELPSPPVYKGSDPSAASPPADGFSLRPLIRRLLSPPEAGLYLTREDLARLGYRLALPPVMGERYRLLESLFQQALQYDLLAALTGQLLELLAEAEQAYLHLAEAYPGWAPYAAAWTRRLEQGREALNITFEDNP